MSWDLTQYKEQRRALADNSTYPANTTKLCSKCFMPKLLIEFSRCVKSPFFKSASCKECEKIYRELNKEAIGRKRAEYRKENAGLLAEKQRSYSQINRKACSTYTANRRKTDPLFKLRHKLSNLIYTSLKLKGYRKNSKTCVLLGADFETVYTHLVQTAIKNYGFFDERYDYHIDHFIPCASAKTEEELIKLQHYTNLQYLTPEDNMRKGAKMDFSLQEWVG